MSRPCNPWRKWLSLLSRSISYGQRATHRMKKPAQRYRRLGLERLEDRTLLSGFYNYDVIAQTGKAGLSGILQGASINDAGKVAFVGQYQDASGDPAGEGIFVGDGSSLSDITFSSYPTDPNRTFGAGVKINKNDEVAAVDRYSFGGGSVWNLRTWNADGKAYPSGNTWYSYATASSPPTAGYDFDALAGSVGLSNNDNVAYAAFDYKANQWQLRLQNDSLPDPLDVPAVKLNAPQSLRPMAADGAGSLGLVVLRDGSTQTSPIVLYGDVPGGEFYSVPIAQAGTPYRFSALGQSPGISADGQIVVFYGVDASGPGIFASVNTASHGRQIERIASASSSGPISKFDPDERIGVNATEMSQGAVTITYVAYDAKGNKGVYASRLTFIPPMSDPTNFKDPTNFVVSDPIPVLQAGDTITGLGTVQDVQLYDPINNTGFGQIAIWVQTSGGDGIVRASSPGLSAVANTVRYNVRGAAISASFQPMFYQYGKPPSSMTLGEAAAALGVDHFNWVQYVTSIPSTWLAFHGSPIAFTDPGTSDSHQAIAPDSDPLVTPPVTQGNPKVPDGTPIDLQPITEPLTAPGLLDPLPQKALGGETYVFKDTASGSWNVWDYSFFDDKPGLYNDVSTPDLPPTETNINLADKMKDSLGNTANISTATQLLFFDEPQQQPGSIPAGQYLSFNTSLVGVRADGTFLEFPKGIGTSFTWRSNAVQTMSATLTDAGGATGNAYFNSKTGELDVGVYRAKASSTLNVVVNGTTVGNLATDSTGHGFEIYSSVSAEAGQTITVGDLSGTFASGLLGDVSEVSYSAVPTTNLPPVASGGVFDAQADNSLPPDDVLTLAPIGNQAVAPGTTVTFTAAATDPFPGATVKFGLSAGAPVGASIDPNTGAFTWTPTTAQAGQVYTITVTATDNSTPALSASQSFVINVRNQLSVTAVTELTPPTPGPLQVAIDFSEALQPSVAQNVTLYKIAQEGASSLPIQSAVYSDTGSVHRVVLTVAASTNVIPGFYHVSIDAGNLSATNGDQGAPKADQLWVDVTSENTLKPITVRPDGSFAVSGSGQSLGYAPPQQVIAGNFTGSGKADLIVLTNSGSTNSVPASYAETQLLLLKNNGDGTYAAPVPISLGGNYTIQTITSADWNHDGIPDLIVGAASSTPTYQYFVLLNDGHGNFTNAPDTPIPVPDPDPAYHNTSPFNGTTTVYDLAGTGGNEIIYTLGNYANVIAKDPYLGYTVQMQLPLSSTSDGLVYAGQVAFADLNGDGKTDLVVAQSGYYADSPNFSVILSTPTGYATGQEIAGDYTTGLVDPEAIAVGHFSDTGHNDIAAVYGGEIQIYQNDGKGNLTQLAPTMLNSAYTARAATFADLNHDGIPDVVVIEQPNNPSGSMTAAGNGEPLAVWTFMADGHGGFTPTSQAPIPLATTDQSLPSSMTLADLDGDGNLDVVLGSSQIGEVRLAINDGTGTMRPPTQPLPFLGQPVNTQSAYGYPGVAYQAFADFTNSGHMGFVALSPGEPGGLEVYVGQSDGTFKHTASMPNPFSSGNSIAWVKVGDVNNDGIPDIVCGDGSSMAVYLGNGDGTFHDATIFIDQASGHDIRNATLADVNNDGNLDVVANLGSAYGILFGDGKGNFSFNINTVVPISLYAPGQANQTAPALGDFNRDGKLDLLVPTSPDGGNTFSLTDYLGKGNGAFTPGPIIYSGAGTSDTQELVGDFNGDGILDILTYANFALGSALPPATAQVFLGNGDGSFRTASDLDFTMGSLPGGGVGPDNIVLGDFSGDGKLDAAASFYDPASGANDVAIYTGDGTGHFAAPQFVTVGLSPFTLVSIPRAPFLDVGSFAVTGHGPTANNVTVPAFAGSSVIIPVLDNASNPDKVPLSISQVSTPAHGTVHVTTDPSGSGGMVIVYAANPGYSGTDSFTYTIQDPAGVQSTATVTVTVSNTGAAPVITGNPSDQTVPPGQTATFTASASGNPPPTVQWKVSTDGGYSFSNLSGATNATLTLNNVTSDMDGYLYQAVFSNSFGTATTSVATLTVSTPSEPYITGNPSSQTVTAGQLVSFLASAGGSPTPLVQWQVSSDGGKTFNNISGATSPILTLTNVTTALSGREYRAVFTNSAGTATSSAATLTVHVANGGGGGGGGGGGVLPPFRPPTLHTPPLLAMIDGILGGIETVIPYEGETVIDRFLGFQLFVSTYDSAGNLESVTFFGINVTFLFA